LVGIYCLEIYKIHLVILFAIHENIGTLRAVLQ